MTTPVEATTIFFLSGIRQAALFEFIKLSGLQPDVLANCLDRAADAAKTTAEFQSDERMQQAVLIAEEEARQVRLARREG